MVEDGWGDDGSPSRPYLAGRRVVLLVEAQGLPTAKVRNKPCDQVGIESGALGHLNEEAVRDNIERL